MYLFQRRYFCSGLCKSNRPRSLFFKFETQLSRHSRISTDLFTLSYLRTRGSSWFDGDLSVHPRSGVTWGLGSATHVVLTCVCSVDVHGRERKRAFLQKVSWKNLSLRNEFTLFSVLWLSMMVLSPFYYAQTGYFQGMGVISLEERSNLVIGVKSPFGFFTSQNRILYQ